MNVGLVVLDGWGINPDANARDAVAAAATPNFDRYRAAGVDGTLCTHGRHVGLPPGQMGNSEVGHITIGAGRAVTQESTRVTDAIARWRGEEATFKDPRDPPIDENDAIVAALEHVRTGDGRLHLLGLVSDGGVHAYQSHLHGLIELAADWGVDAVTHAFTDGRDTPPTSGAEFLRSLESHAEAIGTGGIATVSGRYFAMDRDENWERTRRAYDAIVNREADFSAPTATAAIEAAYERDTTDEFVEPTCIEGGPALTDGDAAIFYNFRADRARQLTRMLADIDPVWPFGSDPPDCQLVTMTEYHEGFDIPVAFPPHQPAATLGEVLAASGHSQLRIAETEKYAHVTYFFNGGREREFDGERREIVPSPDVATYDLQPEMSAPAVTDRAIDVLRSDRPDVLVCNYANPDMVGHTGDYEAAIAAVEAVDTQLGRLVEELQSLDGDVLIAADHGNADDMGTPADPHTAHTKNPVPCIVLPADDRTLVWNADADGTLADIAPTMLALMDHEPPTEMTGRPLVE